MRYSTFISYNHRDRAWASWLHRALETWRVPKRLHGRDAPFGRIGERLPPVFRDREELATSADLAESVKQALAEAATLVVICSPNSAKSRWVDEEVRAFIAMGRQDRIRLVIVDGEPHSGDPATECLPPAILEMASEPLAADARRGQDGRSAAKLKLLAGILDVPYDELRQRETARRQRRLTLIAIASFIGFLAMGGLAVYALITRNEAVRQHELAQQRTLTSERTLEFMTGMFRVSDPSEARGETITAREIVDRGAAMLERGLDDEPAVKAELGITLSEVYGALGLYRRSDELIRQSLAVRHDQPEIRARQLAALGESQSRLGEYDAAIRNFSRAAQMLPEARIATPGLRARILAGLGQAQSAVG
ncbi:MAG: toll/interleukin-1 receptor domain-containing protein, partial [Sphingomonadaceae bacterium]|nr:toll/interleukin-1 receptor domain-containing protein [Sphingomonadaceae bacterium]